MKIRILLICLICSLPISISAQYTIDYQEPNEELKSLIKYQSPPSVSTDKNNKLIIFCYRNAYDNIDELQTKDISLAGLSINRLTRMPVSTHYINNIKYKKQGEDRIRDIRNLPLNAKIANLVWSPNQTKIAFTNTNGNNVELWYYDFETEELVRVVSKGLNASVERPFSWFLDGKSFLVKLIPPADGKDEEFINTVAHGPSIYFSDKTEQKHNRTYSGLLKSRDEEYALANYISSELYKVDLNGKTSLWKKKGLYTNIRFSPDGSYVLITEILPPFSYIVPYKRFSKSIKIYDKNGSFIVEFIRHPSIETIPRGFASVQSGKRNIEWRSDKPASLFWSEAIDNGNSLLKAEFRDIAFQLDAPFNGDSIEILRTKDRLLKIHWGIDTLAVAYTINPTNRILNTIKFNPQQTFSNKIIQTKHYQDVYNDKGSFDLRLNEYNYPVLNLINGKGYLVGEGYSDAGQFPFIDEIDMNSLHTKRIFESRYTDKLLNIISIIDVAKGKVLVTLESSNEYPNYFELNINDNSLKQFTHFKNPFESLKNVYKEIINYKRNDGTNLSAILYLPPNYDFKKKEKLPLLLWAYPKDFKNKIDAEQSTMDKNEFIYPSYNSPIYWTLKNFAILDEVSFPIIGEGENSPNDTYLEQLYANAKAVIDNVDSLGYIDKSKVIIGGHSYGAFMAANLLTHTNLFIAGIAQSGSYNRTLTPFGFQTEERTFWEAPETYFKISPLLHANKMKYPLLLIHGEKDDNVGTPITQSKNYFEALSSLGATVRLVIFPNEGHHLKTQESILHMLKEIEDWLETHTNREFK